MQRRTEQIRLFSYVRFTRLYVLCRICKCMRTRHSTRKLKYIRREHIHKRAEWERTYASRKMNKLRIAVLSDVRLRAFDGEWQGDHGSHRHTHSLCSFHSIVIIHVMMLTSHTQRVPCAMRATTTKTNALCSGSR